MVLQFSAKVLRFQQHEIARTLRSSGIGAMNRGRIVEVDGQGRDEVPST